MSKTFPLQALIDSDRALKAAQAGDSFLQDSSDLSELFAGRLRDLHKAFERRVRLGDPENPRTFAPALASRLARRAAVLYARPPVRRIRGAASDDRRVDEYAERMVLDAAMDQIDCVRQLQRQVLVTLSGSTAHGGVVLRYYEPTRVARQPSEGHYDLLSEDVAIAYCTRPRARYGEDASAERWELWLHEDDGGWTAVRVDGRGVLVEPIFGEERSPLGETLPLALCTDELLMGRAWLPIPQHRVDLILNVAAIAADHGYVAKMEAHSQKIYTRAPGDDGADGQGAPDEVGPGRTLELPHGAEYDVIAHKTQGEVLSSAMDRALAMLAISEDLPPDTFWLERTVPNSSLALRFLYAESERRRLAQVRVTERFERELFVKALTMWWTLFPGEVAIDPTEVLDVQFASALPTDPREAQDIAYKDLATGLLSPVQYVLQRDHLASAEQAEQVIERAREDRAKYALGTSGELVAEGVVSIQNPGATVAGPRTAGVDATKTPGALDPKVASGTEGASVTAAVASAFGA